MAARRFFSSCITCLNDARQQLQAVAKWAADFRMEHIPKDQMQISFNRSRGPGGQNVNKVNTKAEIRFRLQSATWLPEYTRDNLASQEANRINKAGEFILTSERNRTQSQNLEDCFAKLHTMIIKASHVDKEPDQATKDRVKALIKVANEKRMGEKKRRSEAKSRRRDDD